MHLGKGEKHRAIQMQEEGAGRISNFGNILETCWSLEAPGPEAVELSAASGPECSVLDRI